MSAPVVEHGMRWTDRFGAWLADLAALEPAQLRGLVIAVLALGAALGLQVSGAQQAAVIGWVGSAVPIVQALWTRRAVYSPATNAKQVNAAYNDGVADGSSQATAGAKQADLGAPTGDVAPSP